MGLIDFVKDAGEKLFGGKAQQAMTQAAAAPSDAGKVKAANDAAADAIMDYVKAQNLSATGLTITFDGTTSTVSVYGVAPDQATKEKIGWPLEPTFIVPDEVRTMFAARAGEGDNRMSVDQSAPEAKYYTVVAGDPLSKIAKAQYSDANQYMKVFEANKPMLKDPNKIYPGQVLRIPPA